MLIPDPTFFHPGSELSPSQIRIKEFNCFNPKKWFLSSENMIRVVHPRSRIRMLTFCQSRIPYPGVEKALDPDPQHCKNYCTFHLQNGHYALNSTGTLHPKNCHSRIWLWDLGSEIVGPRSGIPNPWVNKEPDLESATLFVKNNFLKLTGQRRASSPSLRGTPCTGLSAQPQLPRSLG